MSIEAIESAADRWLRFGASERAGAGPEIIAASGEAIRELVARLDNL